MEGSLIRIGANYIINLAAVKMIVLDDNQHTLHIHFLDGSVENLGGMADVWVNLSKIAPRFYEVPTDKEN